MEDTRPLADTWLALQRLGIPPALDPETAYRHLLAAGVHALAWDVVEAQRMRHVVARACRHRDCDPFRGSHPVDGIPHTCERRPGRHLQPA